MHFHLTYQLRGMVDKFVHPPSACNKPVPELQKVLDLLDSFNPLFKETDYQDGISPGCNKADRHVLKVNKDRIYALQGSYTPYYTTYEVSLGSAEVVKSDYGLAAPSISRYAAPQSLEEAAPYVENLNRLRQEVMYYVFQPGPCNGPPRPEMGEVLRRVEALYAQNVLLAKQQCGNAEGANSVEVKPYTEGGYREHAIETTQEKGGSVETYILRLSSQEIERIAADGSKETYACQHATEKCDKFKASARKMAEAVESIALGRGENCAKQPQFEAITFYLWTLSGSPRY
jgi:hypothetical protein